MPELESSLIACTLDVQAMAPRLAEIRQITRQHLRSHSLDGRTLRLKYDVGAAERLAHIVNLERACCAFLVFELQVSHSAAELTITAPAQEGTDAAWLFAQFLPGPALPGTSTCACCGG